MQLDALAVRLRPRGGLEAADLGVRLCQAAARSVFPCCAVAAAPIALLAIASAEWMRWLPLLIVWWAKPWLDRTILFVLSRAAFGQATGPADLWNAQRQIWWRHLPLTVTLWRLSPWRSLTQPIHQLEGLTFGRARSRVSVIRKRAYGTALMVTQVFSAAEAALTVALLSLVFWFAPIGSTPTLPGLMNGELPALFTIGVPVAYGIAVLFLEPFYVAAGFAMYLNRRAEIEAWDIEQEFRRAFAA
ncbi:MAG TPA: hypothetical protein VH417_17115 [Vicinamibacterales bacterium]